MFEDRYLDLRMGDFLQRLAADTPAPGSGSASALTVAFAAGVVAMVARCSRASWQDAGGAAAQALALQARVAPLALVDAEVFEDALVALQTVGDGTSSAGELERKLERSAAVPLQIVEAAADTAALAALATELGEGAFRTDAAVAAVLAAGAARAAAHLVAVNLGVQEGDGRLVHARAHEQAASEAAARALDAGR